jgi:hypothetical protein
MMALIGLAVGGVGAIAAYWALEKYFRERQRRMPLNPSARQHISKIHNDVVIDWPAAHQFGWQQLSKEEKIEQARAKLGLDTEYSANIAVCGNSGTGK